MLCQKRSYLKYSTEVIFINIFFYHDHPNIQYSLNHHHSLEKLVTPFIKFLKVITRKGLFYKLDVLIYKDSKKGSFDNIIVLLSISEGVNINIYVTELTWSSSLLNLFVLLHSSSFQQIYSEKSINMDCRKIGFNF